MHATIAVSGGKKKPMQKGETSEKQKKRKLVILRLEKGETIKTYLA